MERLGDTAVPFIGFIRNDHATVKIMAKAATIVPKACDILGISLSDSESEDESADTAEVSGERFPKSHQQQSEAHQSNNGSRSRLLLVSNNNVSAAPRPVDGGGNDDNRQVQEVRPKPKLLRRVVDRSPTTIQRSETVQKSRKRCVSTPSSFLGQSTSRIADAAAPNPPKKRRLPSISSYTNNNNNNGSAATLDLAPPPQMWEGLSPEHCAIRTKMFQDLDCLHEQLAQLAAIEKAKTQMLEKFIQISGLVQQQKQREEEEATPPPPPTIQHLLQEEEEEEEVEAGNDDDDDGTNVNNTAPAAATLINGQGMEEVIFSDADLSIGAEEIVVEEEEQGGGMGYLV